MTRILNEGGMAGHMNHLYDNYDLTFGGIKKIFTAAAERQGHAGYSSLFDCR